VFDEPYIRCTKLSPLSRVRLFPLQLKFPVFGFFFLSIGFVDLWVDCLSFRLMTCCGYLFIYTFVISVIDCINGEGGRKTKHQAEMLITQSIIKIKYNKRPNGPVSLTCFHLKIVYIKLCPLRAWPFVTQRTSFEQT